MIQSCPFQSDRAEEVEVDDRTVTQEQIPDAYAKPVDSYAQPPRTFNSQPMQHVHQQQYQAQPQQQYNYNPYQGYQAAQPVSTLEKNSSKSLFLILGLHPLILLPVS